MFAQQNKLQRYTQNLQTSQVSPESRTHPKNRQFITLQQIKKPKNT
jgi:hypothetical protein